RPSDFLRRRAKSLLVWPLRCVAGSEGAHYCRFKEESRSLMGVKSGWNVIKGTAGGLSRDRVTILGAALAYYAIFSIAPMLVIIVGVAGLVFGEGSARH